MGVNGRLVVRGRARRVGLALSALAVGVGVAAVARWPDAWPWLVTVTALIAAGAPLGLSALTEAQRRRADSAQVARQNLQGTAGRVLPRVRDVADLDARVHRAVLPIPYIRRDVEAEARQSLQCGRPVLLVGSSMVGKSHLDQEHVR